MALYSANRPNRTVTIHRAGCIHIPKSGLRSCGCGKTSPRNQEWWCEGHVQRQLISTFMRDRFWAILLCDSCYS